MPSVGQVYNAWPSCAEGPGGCTTPPQADPLELTTHLLGVLVLTGKRWVVPQLVRAAVKPSDEPLRKGETRKVPTYIPHGLKFAAMDTSN